MLRKGDQCIQFTWANEPGAWRDLDTLHGDGEAQLKLMRRTASHPRPGVGAVFQIGPAIVEHPGW